MRDAVEGAPLNNKSVREAKKKKGSKFIAKGISLLVRLLLVCVRQERRRGRIMLLLHETLLWSTMLGDALYVK
jgi:hypothetical protein